MASVALKNLHKKFGDTTVVNNVNVEIADGEFLVFVGPSGCGKTTTLRMVVGLESISDGEIHIGKNSLITKKEEEKETKDSTRRQTNKT